MGDEPLAGERSKRTAGRMAGRAAVAARRRTALRAESLRRSLVRRWARRSRARRMLAADAALLVLAGAASVWGAKLAGVATEPLGWTIVYGVLTLASIALRGGYRFRLEVSPFEYVGQVVAGTAIAAMFVVAGRVLLDPSGEIAGQSVRIWAFATVYLLAARMGVAIGARRPSRRSLRTLIVGAGDIGHTIGRRLLARPELGLTPIGFLDKEPREGGDVEPLEVLGASWDLEEVVEQHSVST